MSDADLYDVALNSACGLELELDYRMPVGSEDVGPRVVDWFETATDRLAGEYLRELPPEGLPAAGLRDRAGGPFGEPGSKWCSLLVLGDGRTRRRLSTSLRPWSPRNWTNFLAKAPELSIEMSAKFSTLNHFGHAGQPSLTVSAYRPRTNRDWLCLSATMVVGTRQTASIPDSVAEEWSALLAAQAEKWPPAFGYLADDSIPAGSTRTPLESGTQSFLSGTLPLTDSVLRGYSWMTVVSPGILEHLGGAAPLRDSGAFATVVELPNGGAVLKATQLLSDYEDMKVRRVFEALGPALPDMAPSPDEFQRFKLIYEPPLRS